MNTHDPLNTHDPRLDSSRAGTPRHMNIDELKSRIRQVPDFPKAGILFYDITTLLQEPVGLRAAVDGLVTPFKEQGVDLVVGIESRGFIFGSAVADRLGAGFTPVRKPGKLPSKTVAATYALEYGTDSLEMHADGIQRGQRVLIVDDLLATGGTAEATAKLAESLGANIVGLGFVVELDFLKGRDKLKKYDVNSLLHYDQ
jgi:adenine phosphoribosyltransferase